MAASAVSNKITATADGASDHINLLPGETILQASCSSWSTSTAKLQYFNEVLGAWFDVKKEDGTSVTFSADDQWVVNISGAVRLFVASFANNILLGAQRS